MSKNEFSEYAVVTHIHTSQLIVYSGTVPSAFTDKVETYLRQGYIPIGSYSCVVCDTTKAGFISHLHSQPMAKRNADYKK